MAPNRIWIVDGHNMIFAIGPLQRLQVTDRREEARARLAERLERFAIERGQKVLVVFDGNALPSNPDVLRKPLFETVYTRRGEGAADERIIREAGRCLERGLAVTVVTDDVNTLARRLPRGVIHLGVQAFWLKQIEKDAGEGGRRVEGGKRVEGDFSDVEREMMARAATAAPVLEVREPAPPPARAEDDPRRRLRLKRERGRLRQERRLERYARPERRR